MVSGSFLPVYSRIKWVLIGLNFSTLVQLGTVEGGLRASHYCCVDTENGK